MDNTQCNCLYLALLTTREGYCKETARDRYRYLVNEANTLPSPMKDSVVQLLNLAKDTLGNLSSERAYYNNGSIETEHSCNDCTETLKIIKQLGNGELISPIEHTTLELNSEQERTLQPTHRHSDIQIVKILDHRFRGQKLRLSVIINPGNLQIIEDEEKVTLIAKDKVSEYLIKLKNERPRRATHIIRMRPHLLKLLDGSEQSS